MKTIAITELTEIGSNHSQMSLLHGGHHRSGRQPLRSPHELCLQGRIIYLHSSPEGSKVTMAEKHPHVCITFCEGHEGWCICGKWHAVTAWVAQRDMPRKRPFHRIWMKKRALDIIMRQYTSDEFKYSEPAVRNVKVWEVKIDKMTCRSFGLRPSEVTSE